MVKKRKSKKKKSVLGIILKFIFITVIFGAIRFLVLGIGKGIRGIYRFIKKKLKKNAEEKKIKQEKERLESSDIYQAKANYEELKLSKKVEGDYSVFENKINNDSLIALIFGKRGSGKSALGFKLLENIYSRTKRKCFVLGISQDKMPKWISPIDKIDDVPVNSIVLVDEGALSFNSRESMKMDNKNIGKLMAVARHKDLTILFITQNTGMIDKNVLKLVDVLMIKQGSLLQQEMERGEIKKFYEKSDKALKGLEGDKRKYVYILDSDFEGVVEISLPSFWSDNLSKNKS